MCDGKPSPMKDLSHNVIEGIPADVTPTLTPKKLQLAQECPAPVYIMDKTYKDTTEPDESYVRFLYDCIGCLALAHSIKDQFASLGHTSTSPWNLTES